MKPAQETSESLASGTEALAAEILAGLAREPKQIAPKYFYNQAGAELFDAITELPEYYVTRVEAQIFREHRLAICTAIGSGAHVVEPGAGSCEKIRWLLPELEPVRYTPMDISAKHLHASAERLREEFPSLDVVEQVCDHTAGLAFDQQAYSAQSDAPLVFFYPGSSIGNFEPSEAVEFMRGMRARMSDEPDGGGLLIGVDAKKDPDVLHAAYNDSAGITSRFNLNVLSHLNALLEGDLDVTNFEHVARYNSKDGRIEMYLRCARNHSATLAGEHLDFSAGELIHTENSYKYAPDEFIELAKEADFALKELWQDERAWFSVLYFVPE